MTALTASSDDSEYRLLQPCRHSYVWRVGGRQWDSWIPTAAVAGGSGADPAEVDALAKTYTSDDNPLGIPLSEKQARCRAEVYLGSDLSEGALADVRAGRQPRPRTPEDVTELTELASKLADCA